MGMAFSDSYPRPSLMKAHLPESDMPSGDSFLLYRLQARANNSPEGNNTPFAQMVVDLHTRRSKAVRRDQKNPFVLFMLFLYLFRSETPSC